MNTPAPKTSLYTISDRTKRRNASERRFRRYGQAAILVGLMMLFVLVYTIVSKGTGAFQQTFITVNIELLESKLDKKGNRNIDDIKKVSTFGYNPLLKTAVENAVTEAGIETTLKSKDMAKIISKSAVSQIREKVIADPSLIGQTIEVKLLTNSWIDGYLKGRVTRESIANNKNVSSEQLDLVDGLRDAGIVKKTFNPAFILGSDASDQRPEAAGIGVAMVGSLFMMLVVLALALPIGVAASIYLEEFAPKNRITDIIEVNIANLAAVPSIVFGILGLAVFINMMHLPQSAPLVGGMVLTLMTLPTIIIATRASLASVPPSIRQAAMGGGASVGQYGPLVHFGATIGTYIRQAFDNKTIGTDVFIGCGVAAAIAAGFHAPIAGIVFAHEAVLRHFSFRALTPIAISSITSVWFGTAIFGGEPLFVLDAAATDLLPMVPVLLASGLLFGIIAMLFMLALFKSAAIAAKTGFPPLVLALIAAVICGFVAIFVPEILGSGVTEINIIFNGGYVLGFLFLLFVLKLLATSLCIGFGLFGGVFSPAAMIGAAAGGFIGKLMGTLGFVTVPHLLPIAGFAAVTAAVVGAPISVVLVVFELTQSYEFAVAAMLAAVIATFFTSLVFGHSFFGII